MIPPEIKESIFRLKNENKRLKELNSSEVSNNEQNVAMQTLVEELKEREARLKSLTIWSFSSCLKIYSFRLESVNRMLNKKILGLESEIEEAKAANLVVAPRVPGSREELELKLADANKKVGSFK